MITRLKKLDDSVFCKVEAIDGDITEENFGLSQEDEKKLHDNVNIIFHSAATVRLTILLRFFENHLNCNFNLFQV